MLDKLCFGKINFLFTLGIVLFIRCTTSPNDSDRINVLNEGLINSSAIIQSKNAEILHSLNKAFADPSSHDRTSEWLSKAMDIKKYSEEVTTYIDSLKNDFIKQEGFKNNNKELTTNFFSTKNKGQELYERLTKYKEKVMSINSSMTNTFQDIIVLTTRSLDTGKDKNDFTTIFFEQTLPITAFALLSKFQNNIQLNENMMLDYCSHQIVNDFNGISIRSPFVMQSTTHLRPNEEIEIYAGIGSFIAIPEPEVIIDNKVVSTNSYGFAAYKLKAPNIPGKHSIPITINYIDTSGKINL